MAEMKLTYFDIDAGRAEATRIALHTAGIAFEDDRIAFPQFGEIRDGLPFRAVPVLEIDGVRVTQSTALDRYIGKMAGLYPTDPLQALYCDETMSAVEDVTARVGQTMGMTGEALKSAREEFASGWLKTFILGFADLLERGGGEYFAGGELSVADLRFFVWVRSLRKGILDHIPADLVDQLAPSLAAHQERVAKDPRVLAYYARNA